MIQISNIKRCNNNNILLIIRFEKNIIYIKFTFGRVIRKKYIFQNINGCKLTKYICNNSLIDISLVINHN